MTDLVALKAANAKRWANAQLERRAAFTAVARHLIDPNARGRYQAVEAKAGVPWFVIAVIHEREASQDWSGNLAQGDPWNRESVHVPAGRGPFRSWEEAAIDALVNCAPYLARNRDWSIGGTLTRLEEYNGIGYASRGLPSPYVWAGSGQYESGKFVRDGVFDPNKVDEQLGCAGLLMAMMALDPTGTFTGVALTPSGAPAAPKATIPSASKPPAPSISSPAKGSIGAAIASVLSAIFNRKGK
jgi:lysozyme family protein